MDFYSQLLQYVSQLKAEGAPEEVINATIQENGYTREDLEKEARDRIERLSRQAKIKNPTGFAERAIGTLRSFLGGASYEYADNMEAVLRLINQGAPGIAGGLASMGADMLRPEAQQDYPRYMQDIANERAQFAAQNPELDLAAQITGGMATGALESKALSRLVPGLIPQQGQMVNNAMRRGTDAAITGVATSPLYTMGANDQGNPYEGMANDMVLNTGMGIGASVVGGPAFEAVARYGADKVPQLVNRMMPGGGGAGQPPAPPGTGGLGPTDPSGYFPLKKEYDYYYQGLTKFLDSIAADSDTVQTLRKEARRQAAVTSPDDVMAIDTGGINQQRFGKALYNLPGEGAQVAQTNLEGRQLAQGDRMIDQMQSRLTEGISPEMYAMQKAERAKELLDPEYQKIMDVGLPDQLNPGLRELMNADPRMPKLYEKARANEMNLRQNQDPGNWEDPITLRRLETLRRGISSMEQAKQRKDPDTAQALGEYRRRLIGGLDEPGMADMAVPQYGELRRAGFDDSRMIEVSKDAASDFYTGKPEVMLAKLAKMTPAEEAAYKAGFVRQFISYIDPKISDSAKKSNVAQSVDRRDLKKRINLLFDSQEEFDAYWQGVMVETQRSKSYISTVGDATRNTGEMQRLATENLIDPNPIDEVVQGLAPMQRLKDLSGTIKMREGKKISDAFGPTYFARGLDNVEKLYNDAQLAQMMRNYYNDQRVMRSGMLRGGSRGLLD